MKYKGEWIGPDWNTLQAFSKRMNFALKISFFPDHSGAAFGQGLINGSYTGVLAEVVNGRADVAFNSRFLNDPMIQKPYHYTRTNGLDYICFIVPKAETLTRLQILWMTFTVEVWLCVAVTYALMIKSFQLFNKFNLSGERKISDPFMTSLQIVLGMGASMVTKLSTETSHKDIDTLEELDKSGMEIRTSLRYVRDALASNSHTKSLANKIDLEKDRVGYITSRFVFIARIMNLSVSKYSNFIAHFQHEGVALHVVRECPLKYYLTYAVATNFPFLDELNDLLTRFQEFGITYKWKTEIQKLELVYYKPLNSNTSKGLKAYSLNDLWFAFVFLFIGYILSMIALMLEFIFKKFKT
ncbi:PREDICTED: uncharacterized protein LOC107163033 [Diuraphis noxia]|uniref:uncharacterized protein LOC107163033 n=1 Tax=Diuraphis noxia TaxID=143948 RepID=UPI000763AA71|nr:PREDICTED: uncharacterized protein LOC107163033 [Diuraphis noxia]